MYVVLAQKQPESLSKYPFILFLTHTPAFFPFAMCVAGSHYIFFIRKEATMRILPFAW